VSTGFRSGGLNAVSEPFEPIPISYAPDSLINFELGTKGRLLGGRFDYQLDAYFIRWDNIQVQENTADQAFVFQQNAGTAHIKGVEFEFTTRPIDYLTVTFAGSYQDAFLARGASAEEYTNNPTLGLTGDAIPNVPKYQFNAGVNYTRPVYGDWQGMLSADLTYRDFVNAYFASNSFNIELPSYTLVGLRAGVINGPWSVTAFARNVCGPARRGFGNQLHAGPACPVDRAAAHDRVNSDPQVLVPCRHPACTRLGRERGTRDRCPGAGPE